jgi:hypothetical protein
MTKLNCKIIFNFIFLLTSLTISTAQSLNDITVGIVHSEKTKQLLHKNDNNFYPILDWELFFLNQKVSYKTYEDKDLDNFEFKDTDVLILPSVEILTDQALENLKEYIQLGGNLFVLGELGSVDNELNAVKPDALEKLTGLKTSGLPVANEISEKLIIGSSNILSQNISENISLLVLNHLTPLYISEMPSSGKLLGSYQSIHSNDSSYFGIVSMEQGKSRIFWMGCQISQISLREDEKFKLEKVIDNAIKWLSGKPSVWINCLPSVHRSVTFFSFVIGNLNSPLDKQVAFADEADIKLNLFISPSEVLQHADELYTLSSVGDLNLMFDWFDYLEVKPDSTKKILSECWKRLKKASSQKYFGVYIKNIGSDEFLILDPDSCFDFTLDASSKLILVKNHKQIRLINKLLLNDFYSIINTIEENGNNKPENFSELYAEIKFSGGIVTHLFNETFTEELPGYIKKIISAAAEEQSYITTFSDYISWIDAKKYLSVSIEDIPDESKLLLKLKNSGERLMEYIGIVISLPLHEGFPELNGFDFRLDYNSDSGYYDIVVPFIQAGEETSLEINYIH